jgi:hypothetical protein
MARARGSDALLDIVFEATYGTIPTTGYRRVPFVSSNLGAEQGLIEDDTLGYGRAPRDPTDDVINNDGDLVVPVDVRGFGNWLKLMLGNPVTASGTHTFTSGGATLPSMTAQIGLPAVPNYEKNFGLLGNTMRIAMSRRGLLNATLGLVGQGSTDAATSSSGSPTTLVVERFAQATGQVRKDGVQLGSVVAADFTYSNNLDKVETIVPDGMIEYADPGNSTCTGTVTLKFADTTMLTAAASGTPMELTFGWTKGTSALLFTLGRVFLPKKAKKPVQGPGGIQATFNFQASGGSGPVLVAALTNNVASY